MVEQKSRVLTVPQIARHLGVEESLVLGVVEGRDADLRPIHYQGKRLYGRGAVEKIRFACRQVLAGQEAAAASVKGAAARERWESGFGRRLKSLRLASNLSQRELALMVASSQSRIHKIEKGLGHPFGAELVAIAEAFGVTIDSLCREEGSQVEAPGNAAPQPA